MEASGAEAVWEAEGVSRRVSAVGEDAVFSAADVAGRRLAARVPLPGREG